MFIFIIAKKLYFSPQIVLDTGKIKKTQSDYSQVDWLHKCTEKNWLPIPILVTDLTLTKGENMWILSSLSLPIERHTEINKNRKTAPIGSAVRQHNPI